MDHGHLIGLPLQLFLQLRARPRLGLLEDFPFGLL